MAPAQDYYLFYLASQSPKSDLLKMWGEELNNEQVSNSFFTSVDFPVHFFGTVRIPVVSNLFLFASGDFILL